jgi:hypothetical protein
MTRPIIDGHSQKQNDLQINNGLSCNFFCMFFITKRRENHTAKSGVSDPDSADPSQRSTVIH